MGHSRAKFKIFLIFALKHELRRGSSQRPAALQPVVKEAAGLIAEQPPARPLEERDQEVDAIGGGELALDLRADRVVAWTVDEQVGRGQGDRGPRRGGGLPYPVQARVDEGEELASRWREGVVVEDGRVLDRGLEVIDQVVDDLEPLARLKNRTPRSSNPGHQQAGETPALQWFSALCSTGVSPAQRPRTITKKSFYMRLDRELARGAIVAREAAEQRLHEVVDEPGENAGCFGGVEGGDFVAPAFAADLFERRFEAAGDELFVEAWGAGWGQLDSWVDCRWVGLDRLVAEQRKSSRVGCPTGLSPGSCEAKIAPNSALRQI